MTKTNEARLSEIKDYCHHYDWLDYVNLKDMYWLISTIEGQQKEKTDKADERI